jgi:hypothetical protein
MKKKLIIIFVAFMFATFLNVSFAQKTTDSPTPTTTDLQAKVDELKSKIASKVAQLKLVEKRGIYGKVVDSTDTQITVVNANNQNRYVDVDELTKFSSANSKSFGISDIKKGMMLSILGLYNKDSQRLQARVIYEDSPLPNFISGAIYSIDNKNYTFVVAKENGAKNLIDVESISKTLTYSQDTLTKSGFSKIELGETVIVVGYPDKVDKNKTLASRIFLFPEISANSQINLNPNQQTVIASTGSGKKLTPIGR